MLAAVKFEEKFRSHLEGQELVLRVYNMALKWLKTYSMISDIVATCITILGAFKLRIEHRLRDKHHNADALSKQTEFHENREERPNEAGCRSCIWFLDARIMDNDC